MIARVPQIVNNLLVLWSYCQPNNILWIKKYFCKYVLIVLSDSKIIKSNLTIFIIRCCGSINSSSSVILFYGICEMLNIVLRPFPLFIKGCIVKNLWKKNILNFFVDTLFWFLYHDKAYYLLPITVIKYKFQLKFILLFDTLMVRMACSNSTDISVN